MAFVIRLGLGSNPAEASIPFSREVTNFFKWMSAARVVPFYLSKCCDCFIVLCASFPLTFLSIKLSVCSHLLFRILKGKPL